MKRRCVLFASGSTRQRIPSTASLRPLRLLLRKQQVETYFSLDILVAAKCSFKYNHIMANTVSPAMAFGQQDSSFPPQATISLSDTNLMTPDPTSPESSYNIKEERGEDGEPRKPTKKRKSWGQELPTPKTNLPPRYDITSIANNCASTYNLSRKRAKTEDEKEQRRIERVLRNRQAAQSSRERKRQEVEKLEGEKQSIEQQNAALKQQLMTVEHEKWLLRQQVAKMTAQMEAIKRGSSTPDVSTPPLEPDLLEHNQIIKKEFDDYQFALPTPRSSLRASSASFSSPSTATYSGSSTPATISLGLDHLTASPDMTQHPAAMLCDLQCQSREACHVSTRPTIRHAAAIQLYTANLLCLTLISQVYLQLMRPLKMIFTSLRTGSPLPRGMMTSMPMALPLIRWLISTPANLLPHPLPSQTTMTTPTITTTKTSSTTATSILPATPSQTPILRLRMLRRLLLSSPSLARPLRAATGQASRLKTGSTKSGRNGVSSWRIQGIVRRHGEKAGLRRCRSSGEVPSSTRNGRRRK